MIVPYDQTEVTAPKTVSGGGEGGHQHRKHELFVRDEVMRWLVCGDRKSGDMFFVVLTAVKIGDGKECQKNVHQVRPTPVIVNGAGVPD